MSILIFQRILPPYRLPIFRALNKRFKTVLCYSTAMQSASLQSVAEPPDFEVELLPRSYLVNKETAAIQNPLPVLRRHKPQIVVSEFAAAYVTMWLLLLLRPFFGYKLILWTHAIDNVDVQRPFSSRRGRLALWLFKRVDGIICYSRKRCEMVRKALEPQANTQLFVASNTLDISQQDLYYAQCERRGREAVRAELGMQSKFQIVYIGRLIRDKRIDLLIESFNLITPQIDAELHVIGDGPERERVEFAAEMNARISYHGAIWDAELAASYLYAADINLNPGYLGLSLVHAFCFATPIVSCRTDTDGPFHSPEVEYLHDGVNGMFVKSDAAALATAVVNICSDPQTLQSMAQAARRTATEEASLEAMLQGFAEAFTTMQESHNVS